MTRLLLLTLVTALLTATTAARAGTYTVHSCRTPSGAWIGAEGWSAEADTPVVGRDAGQVRLCAAPDGSLALEFGATGLPVASGSWIRTRFVAPDDTTITSLAMLRAFDLAWPVAPGVGDRPYVFHAWNGRSESSGLIDFQAPIARGDTLERVLPGLVEERDKRWDSISLALRCWPMNGTLDCGPRRTWVEVPRLTLQLTDALPPTGDAALVGAGTVRGIGRVGFDAADAGGGVYRSMLTVDGVEVARGVVDGNGGRCGDVEPGNADPYEFAAPRPCPLEAGGEVAFDTRGLRDGSHVLALSVEDAAGNATVIHTADFVTHNAPVSVTAPSIGGDARVGGALDVDVGQWEGTPTVFERRWLRCDADGAACAPIAGASGARYAPTAADAYRRLVAEVVAGNAGGTVIAQSAPSARIADASGRTAPVDDTPARPAPRNDRPGPDAPGAPAPGDGGSKAPPIDTGGIGRLENPVARAGGHTPNGSNASARARISALIRRPGGSGARTVRSASTRRWTAAGRLTDEHGRPIGRARVNAAVRVLGGRWVARDVVNTTDDGRFTYALPAGPSRDVRFTYFPFADSRSFRASGTLRIDVFSPLTITVNRRTVKGRGIVTISGRANGARIPSSGLLVTLQGHQRGFGWRTFRTLRTSRRGTWRTQYRFRSSSGRFAFRAVVPRQGRYPFLTTTSRPVTVVVS